MASDPTREPSPRDTALLSFGSRLSVLQRGYRAAADRAVGHIGLSQAMAWPLVMIGRQGGGVRPGVLADVLAIEGASLARQLDQLVEVGLVERRDDPADRRAKTLHLTQAGETARAAIEDALQAMRAGLFDGVDDADIAASLRVFRALGTRLVRATRHAAAGSGETPAPAGRAEE